MTNAAPHLRQPSGAPSGGQYAPALRPGADFTLGEWGNETTLSFENYLAETYDPDAPYPASEPVDDVPLDQDVVAAGVDLGLVEPDRRAEGKRAA